MTRRELSDWRMAVWHCACDTDAGWFFDLWYGDLLDGGKGRIA